jgi:hypothetical protein
MDEDSLVRVSGTAASDAQAASVDTPGLDAVGHGIFLRPHQPHELKRVLFARQEFRPIAFHDATQVYQLPFGYEVDDSPPMPANQFLNQVMIEESWDRFNKSMTLDANLATGLSAFSVNATASLARQIRSDEEAYYALRSSCIPLWSVYLSEYSNLAPEIQEASIPTPFRHEHRAAYNRFFEYYGSHYVKRVWIGGKGQLFLTVKKSTGISQEEIQAGLQASFGATSGKASTKQTESRDRLQTSSTCCVAGKGGDELKLAAMSSLDEARYNDWIGSIRDNPQIIEIEVAGLWTLIEDPAKAQALRDAYQEATSFTAISAAFAVDKLVYIIRGRRCFTYDIEKQVSSKPRPLVERWPALAEMGFERIDAAFSGRDLIAHDGTPLARKLFLVRKERVVRLDVDRDAVDPGYPRPFAQEFPEVPFERVDAALEVGRDTIIFFSGSRYVRFNLRTNTIDEGYPDYIHKRWQGVMFDRIDAAIYWGNGKVYFFKEDQHIRFDMVTLRADPGYPRQIVGNYVEDWRFFD